MDFSWNLSQIYQSREQLDSDYQRYKELSNKTLEFAGKLNGKDILLAYFKHCEELSKLSGRIIDYLFLTKSLDGSDAYAIEKMNEFELFSLSQSKLLVPLKLEILKIDTKKLKEWSKLPEFADYDDTLEDIIKEKKHKLPLAQEKLMIAASASASQSELFDCLDNVEIKFGHTLDESGKRVKLTMGNYYVLSKSHIRKVRKMARQKLTNAYGALNQTIACNYISHLQYQDFVAKSYKYKSTLDMCMQSADLPKDLPRKVAQNVSKYIPIVEHYYAWRKKFMKLDKFEACDLSCNLFDKSATREYSLDEACDIIREALEPLGQDYVKMFDTAIKNNWFDTRFLPKKESGAYSANIYGVHPFVLMTYDKTQYSISTMAHEFGHSMHSYFSEKSQPYSKHDYELFVAEVASTVNEVLLANYFIKKANTREEKIIAISEFLNTFIATVMTQSMYTEFELFVHDKIDKQEPLTYAMLNRCFYEVRKKYSGKNVQISKKSGFGWSMIPHFYRDFYVFRYSTGFVAACAIANKLLSDKNYYKQYRKFLSGGSSKKPCEMLKVAGVDILNSNTYDEAFELFENYLKILEEV